MRLQACHVISPLKARELVAHKELRSQGKLEHLPRAEECAILDNVNKLAELNRRSTTARKSVFSPGRR